MSTIFSKIIAREIPAQFVYEDDTCIVIMDKFPAVTGQTLVISKKEVDYIFDLPVKEYEHILTVAKRIAHASDQAFETERTCLVIEGFEVPHVHIKLYPMTSTEKSLGAVMTELSETADTELQAQADKIKTALAEVDV